MMGRPGLVPAVALLGDAFDPDGDQLAGLDQFADDLACCRCGQREVALAGAAEVFGCRDTQPAGGDPDELAAGLVGGRLRRGQYVGREHALGEVVDALEVPPSRDRHLTRAEQALDGDLRVLPVPHPAGARIRIRVGPLPPYAVRTRLAGRERALLGDDREHLVDVPGPLGAQPPHPRDHRPRRGHVGAQLLVPHLPLRRAHPPAQQRVVAQRQQRGLVSPEVLEQLPAVSPADPVERRTRVVPDPGEHRQVMRPAQHVHRIELQHPGPVDRLPHPPDIRTPARPRFPEPLRVQGDPPRNLDRDLITNRHHEPNLSPPRPITPARPPSARVHRPPYRAWACSTARLRYQRPQPTSTAREPTCSTGDRFAMTSTGSR